MKLKLKYFLNFSIVLELFLFVFTLFIAIGIAINYRTKVAFSDVVVVQEPGYSALNFIIIFIIATAVLLLILKYIKNPWLIKTLFYLAIIEGLLIFSQSFFSWPVYLIFMAIMLL